MKIVGGYLDELRFTERQRKAFNLLKNVTGAKEELLNILQENSIKRTTAYSIL
ncbi:hypothetical protein [Thermosipho melanesiensis]|nr:hypothetical protein [Thermosipho melanesiensis]